MANILVFQMQDFQSQMTATGLRRSGHVVSIVDMDIGTSNRGMDRLVEKLRDTNPDIFFIDGMIAYNAKLRESLNERGLTRLPLLVAYLRFIPDKDLQFSGCDFGKEDPCIELYPSDMARAFLQYPVPKLEGVIYNPSLWKEEKGLIIRK